MNTSIEPAAGDSQTPVNPNMVTLTYIIYGMHLFSAVTGVLTSASILGAFISSWPSIIAVILNYVKRSATRGTYLESHFRWQIRTFWFALFWGVLAILCFVSVIGIPAGFVLVVIIGIWVLYRMVRGLLRLKDQQTMPVKS